MIPNLAEGDTVDITIRGAKVYALPDPDDDPGERFWTFSLPAQLGIKPPLFSVPLDYSEVTVEHAGPENWPPQAGDIWSDEDDEFPGHCDWHVLPRNLGSFEELVMHVDSSSPGITPSDFLQQFPKARLLRRREVSA